MLCAYSQRMSNHADLSFTDEEVITLYLFGVMTKHTDIKQIHTYTDRHLRDWFLKIPGYTAFVQRLKRVADVFVPFWRWFKTNKKVETPEYIGITGASHHDGKIFDQIRPVLHNNYLYGDKAYLRSDAKQVMQKTERAKTQRRWEATINYHFSHS